MPDLLQFGKHDVGNGQRLGALYGNQLRYCHDFKKWLVWDGRRWQIDASEQVRQFAKFAMVELLRQVLAVSPTDESEGTDSKTRFNSWKSFAIHSLNAGSITNLLTMARSDFVVRPADLDTDPYLINFLNGSVDLRTGELRPHCREGFLTKLVHHDYDPRARCPLWLDFLYKIMRANGEMIRYLQRALGYSLTGSTIEKVVFVLFGSGNNGKTTMLATVRKLIEEYACLLQVDTLMVRQESNNTHADLADLRGARFVQTSETEDGQRLAQGKLKRITQGMGVIKAVRKYENWIEFPESHKLWMDTNRRPAITDADDRALFNRLHPIPFTVTIPDQEIDKDLPAKLLAEAEGILAWLVPGARLWHQRGLSRPPAVSAANELWRTESDPLERFIEERCKPGGDASGAELYDAYLAWTANNGNGRLLSVKDFGSKLAQRPGIQKKRTKQGAKYIGVQVRRNGRTGSA